MNSKIKFCTFNVKGLGDGNKRRQVFEWLKANNYGIALLQELHCENLSYEKWQKEWGGKCFFSGNTRNSSGVGILLNPKHNFEVNEHKIIIEGRLQALSLTLEERTFTVINQYAPNDGKIDFLNTLETYLIENNDKSLFIGGDFNLVLNDVLDKKGGNQNANKNARAKLNSIIKQNELNDIWRILNPNKREYTWHSNHNPPIFCRLDYFLVTTDLLNSIHKCKINSGFKSDHSIVILEYTHTTEKRGPGYFKLNNSILFDTQLKQKIKNSIKETIEINREANPNTLWEVIKGNVRNETILFTSHKQKQEKKEEKELSKEIDELEKIYSHTVTEELKNRLNMKKLKLEDIIKRKTLGNITRAKAEWVEGAEKNTKFFANLERKRQETKTIKHILINGTEITNPVDILTETRLFYENLYKKQTTSSDNSFFDIINEDLLNENDKNSCEGPITEAECFTALKEMSNNKSPGSDGITTEFYKLFWNDIKKQLVNSLNHSYTSGNLTDLQKQSIITLLPKKDKNTSLLSNWRPISLLNVDYKIATKVLANRMKKVLPKIIDSNQTGFLKSRYIGENIRTIIEVIDHVNMQDLPGMIFFADFEKAFDSIDHEFMFKCLEKMNFGSSFIKWIKLFYNDVKSCVSNNGFLSDYFGIERGVRQGCPLSPYLFICAIEFLYKSINANPDINGIKIENEQFKYTAFADDATFFLNGTTRSLDALVKLIDKYSETSGLKLNNSKSTILKIGSTKYSTQEIYKQRKFIWTSDKACTLGITFTNNKNDTLELNYNKQYSEFNACLESWKKHTLSLIGKITVIKTFAIPKLVYPLTVLEQPSDKLKNLIKSKIFSFLWDGKPEKIKREIIVQPYENGGLKMLDFDIFLNTLKCSWIKRLSDPNNQGKWKNIYLNKLKKVGGIEIFSYNLKTTDGLNIHNKFLQEIVTIWSSINFQNEIDNVNSQIIWNNSHIIHNNKMFYFEDWVRKGVKTIAQLYDHRHKVFFTFEQVKQKFNLKETDFLRYYQILSSIPKQWKNKLKTETENAQSLNLYHLYKTCKSAKYILKQKQLKKKLHSVEVKPKQKWENRFDDLNWKHIYTMPFVSTIDTKLRVFQYKYLMRIYPTNEQLFKMKIVNSVTCTFCNSNTETLEHLFWRCPVVQNFWTQIVNFMNEKNMHMTLNFKKVSFGSERINENIAENYILLTAKYFIAKCKYTEQSPDVNHYLNYIKQKEQIERIIATNKGKITIHEQKWNKILS